MSKRRGSMTQGQVDNYAGFLNACIQLDSNATLQIHDHKFPQVEIRVKDTKVTLTRKQWNTLLQMIPNVNLAFGILEQGVIGELSEEHKQRRINETFNDLTETLGL